MRNLRVVLGVCVFAAMAVLVGEARQRPPAAFDVIVVFRDGVDFENFRAAGQADPRGAADPAGWGYLDRGVLGAVQALERGRGFNASHVYSAAVRGFSARLNAAQISALENDDRIAFIEADGVMSVNQGRGGGGGGGGGTTTQTIPWGIARIGATAGDGSPDVVGVRAYIIDTGIGTHADLNLIGHINFAGGKNTDCSGHGTHVAGTVGARDNTREVVGVAPGVPLVGVKVLGCNGSGTTSGVIKGVDWVTAQGVYPAVANMSLGGGVSGVLDAAVVRSADSGVFYALAAGNSGADACNSSPARVGKDASGNKDNGIMTTAATASNDTEPTWSNYGSCVDIWAPGVSILSTKMGGGTTTMSGTSMASPHVAGTAALALSGLPGEFPASLEAALRVGALSTGKSSQNGAAIKLINAGVY